MPDAHLGQDGYPLRLARIEGGAAILRHLHDKGFGKAADRRARGIDNADELAARAGGQSVLVGDVAGEHHLATPDKVNHRAEAIEGGTGLPFRGFV